MSPVTPFLNLYFDSTGTRPFWPSILHFLTRDSLPSYVASTQLCMEPNISNHVCVRKQQAPLCSNSSSASTGTVDLLDLPKSQKRVDKASRVFFCHVVSAFGH